MTLTITATHACESNDHGCNLSGYTSTANEDCSSHVCYVNLNVANQMFDIWMQSMKLTIVTIVVCVCLYIASMIRINGVSCCSYLTL